jgi:hypothetical protein
VNILVVYESVYGNTKAIAEAVAEGLAEQHTVELTEVGEAPDRVDDRFDLVVVGGPTHGFGLSSGDTRRSAAKKTGSPAAARGIREWLAGLEHDPPGVPAAAFDTRFDKPAWLVGSAARGIEKRLRRMGVRAAAPAGSFLVTGGEGPLKEGEAERARRWGAGLA